MSGGLCLFSSIEPDTLTVTNKNHFSSSPLQFLDVDQCTTTSGLLNFIGTLSLLEAQKQGDAYFKRAEAWLKSAMATRRDEWLRWFYHFVEQAALFAPSKILVDPANPESYVYDYSGE